ncbi:MAG: hypothetical protein R3D44_03605 [Hyphomicrobiaceae bacterium]
MFHQVLGGTLMIRDGTGRSSLRIAVTAGLLFTVASFGAASTLRAQSTYPAEVENQCKDDYYRYCSPYALGSDELRRCMEAKGRTLSSHCQKALKDAGYVRPNRLRRGS